MAGTGDDGNAEDRIAKDGDVVVTGASDKSDRAFVADAIEPVPVSPVPASIPCARKMQMNWHTDAGEVLFYYPSDLSEQDARDVRELLWIALKGIDRRAQAMSAFGQDPTGLEAKPASAVPQGCAQGEAS